MYDAKGYNYDAPLLYGEPISEAPLSPRFSLNGSRDASATALEPVEPATTHTFSFAYICIALALAATLTYYHAFAASAPNLAAATCASTLRDGPCASSAGAACTLRCPPRCADAWVGNATAYAVFGGDDAIYRGDSKLCRAALHAGLLNDGVGGCARVTLGGPRPFFPGATANGVASLPAPYYPTTLLLSASNASFCGSLQWPALLPFFLLASGGGLLLLPRALSYALMCGLGFWYLVLTARGGDALETLLVGVGGGVSAAALVAAAWRAAGVRALGGERQVFTAACSLLLPFTAALHMNFLTALLPDVDLDAASIAASPNSALFLAGFVVALVGALGCHARLLWRDGLCARFAFSYGVCLAALAAATLALRGNATLHLHHSLLAVLLLPLTRFTVWYSVACHGALLGVLLNGVAFWGVSGPWDDAREAGGGGGPRCAPTAAPAGLGSINVSWGGCGEAPPVGALVELIANGAVIFAGCCANSTVLSAVPAGSNLSFVLRFLFANGGRSAASPTGSIYFE